LGPYTVRKGTLGFRLSGTLRGKNQEPSAIKGEGRMWKRGGRLKNINVIEVLGKEKVTRQGKKTVEWWRRRG